MYLYVLRKYYPFIISAFVKFVIFYSERFHRSIPAICEYSIYGVFFFHEIIHDFFIKQTYYQQVSSFLLLFDFFGCLFVASSDSEDQYVYMYTLFSYLSLHYLSLLTKLYGFDVIRNTSHPLTIEDGIDVRSLILQDNLESINECCICLEIDNSVNMRMSSCTCNMWYHETCILEWLMRNPKCPICKQ
jgi:hypothetical protein